MYIGYVLGRQAGWQSDGACYMAYVMLAKAKNAKLVLAVVLGSPPLLPFFPASRDPALATAQGRLQPDAVHFNYRAPSALEWCLNFEFWILPCLCLPGWPLCLLASPTAAAAASSSQYVFYNVYRRRKTKQSGKQKAESGKWKNKKQRNTKRNKNNVNKK